MTKQLLIIGCSVLLLTMVSSCKSEQKKMDDKVRSHLKEYYKDKRHSNFSDFKITKIAYDTIGDGKWAYNLASLMLNTEGIISDSVLYKELKATSTYIDTNDNRLRIIASIYGRYKSGDDWMSFSDPSYTIGIIGDSLTAVNESSLYVLLNICNKEEMRIVDIANVVDLGKRSIIIDSMLRKQINLEWYHGNNKDIVYSNEKSFVDGKKIKDTSLSLQFVGYLLNEIIDTISNACLQKEWEFKDYCKYKTREPLIINDSVYSFEIHLYTLEGSIAMIKAICKSDISYTLEKMFQIKYGEATYGSVDSYFFETVYGTRQSVWNFGANCIVINENREDVGKWDYPSGSNQKKWFHYYYYFHNVTVIYCDKQMYRRLKKVDEEMQNHIKEQKQIEHSRKLEIQKTQDSIFKEKETERLKRNSIQI